MRKPDHALLRVFAIAIAAAAILGAQPPSFHDDRDRWGEIAQGPPPQQHPNRPPMERAFHGGPSGRWWMDPTLVARLGLTPDQQKRIDALFQQSRLKLIDLSASLEKEEAILEPLLEADRPDESQVLAQIDRIAQARADLEKANARMLLGFRGVLSLEQWKKLQAEQPRGRPDRP